ncbi:MAG TPA: hypothetical protein H9966_06760 [Candidatus Prevotella avicola]|uniref:Uncharacterized protein n=1 Tax=Candidatus Prevotella avicola TaxID=2838738 RepID=A0A9D2JWW5_9BACT|nr:hypothetical protein [Candidatus Prevotella avicola]
MRHLITKLANMMAMAALLMTATPMMAQEEQPITVDGCRPLLAPDCVVDDIVEQVTVQGSGNTDYTKVQDADLTNYTVIPSVANVSALYNPIISIRDLKHKYKGGQKVGFVVGGSGSLLTVEVLKGLTIMLFNDNKQVGEAISISTENFSVLSLNLISQKGQRTIMVDTPEDVIFDEIMLCSSGVADLGLLSSMQIYYGFVGDGEKKLQNTSETDNSFSSFETIGKEPLKITNPDDSHEDYKIPATILDLASYGNVTVQYNDKNNNPVYGPKKAEVGFVFSSASLAKIKLFGSTTLRLKKLVNNTEHVVMEKVLRADVLDIEVGNGEEEARYSMIIDTDKDWNAIQLETGGAGLGVEDTYIKYAYVREFVIPEAAERHDLNLSADALLCANENTYTLSSGVDVKWKLASPSGANVTIDSGDKYVKNTNVTFNSGSPKGIYVFEATDDDGCTGKVTLYRGKTQEMEEATANAFTGTPLDAINDHVALSKPSDGGLLVIDGLEDAENIIDGDLNSYATYAKGLQLAANTCIVSVKKDDDQPFAPAQAAVVGFVAETPGKLLGADVLTFYRIVLYNNGDEVYNSATGTNNVINASLIGAPGSGMIRYAIKVPEGTEFDEFALCTSGVLNLDLTNQSMKIYNAFTADENLVTMPVGPLGSKYVTSLNVDNGARINYAKTGAQTSLVNVVSVSNGLGYLVDNNLTTGNEDGKGMTNYAVAGVLSGSRLAIKTGRQYQGGRWVGLVMKRTPGLADVEVLNLGMTISTAINGKDTGDKGGTNASLLSNTNIIGWGDYFYVSVYATQPFDEVRFEKGELVQALSELEYLGFYTYADQDMDGIPDEEDPDFCEEDIVIDFSDPDFAVDINSLCASNAKDKVTATITAKSATQVAYTISDIDRKEVVKSGKLSSADGKFTYIIDFTDPSLLDGNGIPQYGRYELKVTLPDNPLFTPGRKQFTIHATQTRWQPQLTEDMKQYSSDWNEWKNWTQGVPVIGCTDVVIPGNAQSYPVLSPKAADAATDINSCENIHFMTGGEVKGTEYLKYEYASVDFELQAGRYYMLSTPLKATYAGDYFIPAEMNGSQDNDLFTRLDEKTSPENRFSPRIYQRLWEHSAPIQEAVENVTGDVANLTTTVSVDETRWTPPFNGLTQPYGFENDKKMVTGFSLKADAEDLTVTTLKFRMPKEHTRYHYFNDKKQETDLYENIDRGGKAGKLYTDDLSGEDWNLKLNLVLDNPSDYFVVGNPFMTHINIQKFLKDNPSITELKVYDGNAMNSAILSDGELVSNTDGTWTSIAPMQAFFAKVETASETCPINFTKDMLETQPENNQMLLSYQDNENRAMESSNQVMIKAKVGNGASSQALIRFNDHASTAFVNGEDGALLVDNEARPQIQVFTLANNRAADIQQTPQTDHITLGVIMAEPAPLELSLTGDTDWNLYDIKTGMTYSMAGGNIVNLGTVSSSTGRYVLVRDVTAIENIKPASGLTLSRTSHGTISIRTADGSALRECSVYSIDGKLIDSTRGGMSEVELKAAKGICIVKAAKADGTSYVQKM